jgi:flagellar basal body-associated protein FliL
LINLEKSLTVVMIVLATAVFWLALSIAAGLLFARMATIHKRSEAPAKEVELGPQLRLAPAASAREHVV